MSNLPNESQMPDDEQRRKAVMTRTISLLTKKFKETSKQLPHERPISRSVMPKHYRLVRTRRWMTLCTGLLVIGSVTCCFLTWNKSGYLAAATLISAIALLSLTMAELVKGAGLEVQTQIKTQDGYRRDYSFLPSLRSPYVVLGTLSIVIFGVICSFAAAYVHLASSNGDAFSASMADGGSLYFSVVTFATVGFGDIFPKSAAARLIVSTEILLSLFIIAVTLSAAVSWSLSSVQRNLDDFTAERKRRMNALETILKATKMGVYMDEDTRAELKKIYEAVEESESGESGSDPGKTENDT